MSERTDGVSQSVTLSHGNITLISGGMLIAAVVLTAINIAVSIIAYDRVKQQSDRADQLEIRVMTLEAYESARTKNGRSGM